jgi:hypothetical protein
MTEPGERKMAAGVPREPILLEIEIMGKKLPSKGKPPNTDWTDRTKRKAKKDKKKAA